jgi:hypothetical protein
LATAGQEVKDIDTEAFAFIAQSLSNWRQRLCGSLLWDSARSLLKLYRGLTGEVAIRSRYEGPGSLSIGEPTCFTTDENAAKGFARRGNYDGAVVQIEVPISAVVFADLDGLFQEGGAHYEREVVVIVSKLLPMQLLHRRIEAGNPKVTSRHAKTAWLREHERLKTIDDAFSVQFPTID